MSMEAVAGGRKRRGRKPKSLVEKEKAAATRRAGSTSDAKPAASEAQPKASNGIGLTLGRSRRVRKSVDRFVVEHKPPKHRTIVIPKGNGMALKDIPILAYKLSKKCKSDHIVRLLHLIIYGKRLKTANMKADILEFSGFVWNDNKVCEKVTERTYKIPKEELLNVYKFLELNLPKYVIPKEELALSLLDFLKAPFFVPCDANQQTEQMLGAGGVPCLTSGYLEANESSRTEPNTAIEGKRPRGRPRVNRTNVHPTANSQPEMKRSRGRPRVNRTDDHISESLVLGHSNGTNQPDQVRDFPGNARFGLAEPQFCMNSLLLENKTPEMSGGGKETSRRIANGDNGKVVAPTEAQLSAAIRELLREVDFKTATLSDVVKSLGRMFNKDFTDSRQYLKILVQEELGKIAVEGCN